MSVVAGDEQLTVSWSAVDQVVVDSDSTPGATPSPTSAPSPMKYRVTLSPGGFTCTTTKLTCVIDSLTNDVKYTASVIAIGDTGTSDPTRAVVAVAPVGVPDSAPPGVPVIEDVDPGNAQVDVTVSPGSGIAPRSYIISSTEGGFKCKTTKADLNSCTVKGLQNDTEYVFVAQAVNRAGLSDISEESIGVTPTDDTDRPGAPSLVSVTTGDGEAVVHFTAGGGGRPRVYIVTASPGGLGCSSSSDHCVVTGLVNGRSYTVVVAAKNRFGKSSPSGQSDVITPVDGGSRSDS